MTTPEMTDLLVTEGKLLREVAVCAMDAAVQIARKDKPIPIEWVDLTIQHLNNYRNAVIHFQQFKKRNAESHNLND